MKNDVMMISSYPNDKGWHVDLPATEWFQCRLTSPDAAIVVDGGSEGSWFGEGVLVGLHYIRREGGFVLQPLGESGREGGREEGRKGVKRREGRNGGREEVENLPHVLCISAQMPCSPAGQEAARESSAFGRRTCTVEERNDAEHVAKVMSCVLSHQIHKGSGVG